MGRSQQTTRAMAAVLLSAALVVTGCGQKSGAVKSAAGGGAKKPVKVGFVNPLSGDAATYGQMGKRAIEIALEEINGKGGAGGHQLDVNFQDDAGDPKQTTSATQKLADDKETLVMIGSSLSSNTLAIIPIIDRAKLSDVSYAASSSKLSGASPYFFRTASMDAEMGRIMAGWAIKSRKAQKIAALYVNNDYGNLLGSAFMGSVKEQGGNLVGSYTYLASDRDFQAILTQVNALQADVIALCSTYTDAALIVKQARAMGIKADFVGSSGINSSKFLEIAGPAAEGVTANASFSPTNPAPKSQEFTKKFREKYNLEPDHFAALAYDTIYVIADAVARADKAGELNREGVRKALAASSFDGLTGTVAFTDKGDWIRPYLAIKVKDGKYQMGQ